MVLDPDAPLKNAAAPQRQATWQALEHWPAAGDTGPLLAQARFACSCRTLGERQVAATSACARGLQRIPAPGRHPAAAPGQLGQALQTQLLEALGAALTSSSRTNPAHTTPACSAWFGPAASTPAASTKHRGKPWVGPKLSATITVQLAAPAQPPRAAHRAGNRSGRTTATALPQVLAQPAPVRDLAQDTGQKEELRQLPCWPWRCCSRLLKTCSTPKST